VLGDIMFLLLMHLILVFDLISIFRCVLDCINWKWKFSLTR